MKLLESIPLFPLNIFRFPGESLELHIFEPRYKQLINHLLEKGTIQFGIPFLMNNQKAQIGCLVNLKRIYKKYDDGRLDLQVGIEDFFLLNSVEEPHNDKLYYEGNLFKMDFQSFVLDNPLIVNKLEDMIEQFGILGRNFREDCTDVELIKKLVIHDLYKIDYVLLHNQRAKENYLYEYLQNLEAILKQMKAMKNQFWLN